MDISYKFDIRMKIDALEMRIEDLVKCVEDVQSRIHKEQASATKWIRDNEKRIEALENKSVGVRSTMR